MNKNNFEQVARNYAKLVDTKPIHVYYERPNLLSLLPKKLLDLKILDLGCGSGWYAEYLVNRGAKVSAIDSSQTMIELTRQRVPNCEVFLTDLEGPLDCLGHEVFDIILAPLVIHYIADWYKLFTRLSDFIKSNGSFIFSTHSPYTEYIAFGLENYFEKILVTDHWENIGEVKFYHHSLHELTEALYQADFVIERMLEPMPLPEMKEVEAKMYQTLRSKPWFLFVKAIKK